MSVEAEYTQGRVDMVEPVKTEVEANQQTDLEKEHGPEGVILGTFLYLARTAGGIGISVSDIARCAGLSTDEQTIKHVQEVLLKYGYRQVRQFEIDETTRSRVFRLEQETTRLEVLKSEFMALVEKTKMYELKAVPMKSAKDVMAIRDAQIQIQIKAVELTNNIPIEEASADISASQTILDRQDKILSEVMQLLKSIPTLRKIISKHKKDAVPVGENGDALFTIEQPRRSAQTHVITSLDSTRLNTLVVNHMIERKGRYDFELDENSEHANISLNDQRLQGYGVANPAKGDGDTDDEEDFWK